MRLIIGGREYDAAAQPFIGDLRLLKAEFGFGYGEVVRRMQSMDTDNFFNILDDDSFLEGFIAWVWMLRLRSGERDVTRADVEMLALDQVQWISEPGDELPEDGSVPTSAPAGSSRGEREPSPDAARSAAATSTKRTSKTSTKRSTAA